LARRTAKQKAATRKLVALNKKRKTKTKKRTSTKKGGVRKTARRAFKGLTKTKRRMPRKSSLKGLTSSSTLKKVALGVGGATLATAMISFIAPNSSLGKFAPAAGAYALGGIEGIIGNFALGMLKPSSTSNANVAPQMEVL
tara:strand:- start:1769 stop:2191 length:423 start_codon:yes stop_codon:yes gene_type:complete